MSAIAGPGSEKPQDAASRRDELTSAEKLQVQRAAVCVCGVMGCCVRDRDSMLCCEWCAELRSDEECPWPYANAAVSTNWH